MKGAQIKTTKLLCMTVCQQIPAAVKIHRMDKSGKESCVTDGLQETVMHHWKFTAVITVTSEEGTDGRRRCMFVGAEALQELSELSKTTPKNQNLLKNIM